MTFDTYLRRTPFPLVLQTAQAKEGGVGVNKREKKRNNIRKPPLFLLAPCVNTQSVVMAACRIGWR